MQWLKIKAENVSEKCHFEILNGNTSSSNNNDINNDDDDMTFRTLIGASLIECAAMVDIEYCADVLLLLCEDTIIVPVVCIPAVVDFLISISSLPVITISATTSDACEDVGDVVISSKIFVCKIKRKTI